MTSGGYLAAALLIVTVVVGFHAHIKAQAIEGQGTFVRVNQVGFAPGDAKRAYVLSGQALDGRKFEVTDASGAVALRSTVGPDRGPYGSFAHLYTFDLSAVRVPGSYR